VSAQTDKCTITVDLKICGALGLFILLIINLFGLLM
jgi:hypothetical protein